MQRGLRRPLLESEIRDAQDRARSAKEASRLLNVKYDTYKKYAKMYGIFDRLKNQPGIGINKGWVGGKTKYLLKDVLEGKYPDYPTYKLKDRLIRAGYKEQKCDCCGLSEKRIIDGKTPLLMAFKDGDTKNKRYENLEFLCYNCYFFQVGSYHGIKSIVKLPTWRENQKY